jgi:hypothetical protein
MERRAALALGISTLISVAIFAVALMVTIKVDLPPAGSPKPITVSVQH